MISVYLVQITVLWHSTQMTQYNSGQVDFCFLAVKMVTDCPNGQVLLKSYAGHWKGWCCCCVEPDTAARHDGTLADTAYKDKEALSKETQAAARKMCHGGRVQVSPPLASHFTPLTPAKLSATETSTITTWHSDLPDNEWTPVYQITLQWHVCITSYQCSTLLKSQALQSTGK